MGPIEHCLTLIERPITPLPFLSQVRREFGTQTKNMKTPHTIMGSLAALLMLAGAPNVPAQTSNAAVATSSNSTSQTPTDASAVAAKGDDSEKVVLAAFEVTGSFIKRDSFEEMGAPVSVLTSQD